MVETTKLLLLLEKLERQFQADAELQCPPLAVSGSGVRTPSSHNQIRDLRATVCRFFLLKSAENPPNPGRSAEDLPKGVRGKGVWPEGAPWAAGAAPSWRRSSSSIHLLSGIRSYGLNDPPPPIYEISPGSKTNCNHAAIFVVCSRFHRILSRKTL